MGPLALMLFDSVYWMNDDPGGTPGELDPPPHDASSGVTTAVESSIARGENERKFNDGM